MDEKEWNNPPGVWENLISHWRFIAPGYAVYGSVRKNKTNQKFWDWEARTMLHTRIDGEKPQGIESGLEHAKTKVEEALFQTNTCEFPVTNPS